MVPVAAVVQTQLVMLVVHYKLEMVAQVLQLL
jgi:hypothetical protein